MKKNLLKLLIVAMLAVILTTALVACNGTTIQKVDFTITFDVDGETYFEIKTQGSEVLEMPTNPTKENYIFDGWYWDKDEWQRPFTASSLANEPLTDNLTVYAKWTEVELTQKIFTVSFNSMGGTAVEPVKVQYGKLLTAPERPTKLGYALVGWYKEADYSTKWDFNLDKVMEDITLYAKWVDESDATGCDILSATDFDKEGYTYSIKVANSQEHFVLSQAITVSPYAEWTVTSDIAGKEVIPSGTVDLKVGDNTFYINVVSGTGSNKKQYTIKIRRREIYNVTYQFGNGQADETVSVEEDSKPENKTPENKQGYTFEGWILDDELWKFDTDVVTESITLVAKWNANRYEERDGKIYFGEYPQTKETDNGITATLAQMSGDRPVRGNSGEWTDYGYYINGSTSEYMWYIDLEYGEDRYRGVYFTSYRPSYTTTSSSTGNTYQDDNGYYTNTLYWFKWEPIEWRVLERTDGEAFLMSNVILDSQQYYRTDSGTRTIDGKTVYPNNYKESDIRAWLNGTFFEWAFDELDQSIIKTTLVDNSASTTSSSSNSYACENTNDKLFLLSYKDVLNTSYGFNSSSGNYDTARRLKTTGYAQSQGAYTLTDSSYRGNGWWWLRSPYGYNSYNALHVNNLGSAGYSYVYYSHYGVVPALRITL